MSGPRRVMGVENWFWDARLMKVVDKRPAWWDERRKELGRGEPKVTPTAVYELKGGKMVDGFRPRTDAIKLDKAAEAPCDSVNDVSECYIVPTEKAEKSYGYSDNEPWKRVNRRMWPTVWRFFVKFYYSGEYYSHTTNTSFNQYKSGPGSVYYSGSNKTTTQQVDNTMEEWRKSHGGYSV